jgi:hypothetical protein
METSQSAQFHTINPDLGFIALAGASTAGLSPPLPTPYDTVPSEPAIFVKAQNDQVVPGFFENITYNVLTAPHRLISIGESGHLVFTDTCETIPHTGVLPALLSGLKISIPASFRGGISDGCAQPNIAVTRAWPAINQVVVAGVRWMFGFDATQGGLNNLGAAYGRKIVPLDTTAPMK